MDERLIRWMEMVKVVEDATHDLGGSGQETKSDLVAEPEN
jgi:hypothetical protein